VAPRKIHGLSGDSPGPAEGPRARARSGSSCDHSLSPSHHHRTKRTMNKPNKVISGYGWHPDLPDQRDRLYAAIAAPPRKLPGAVDLRPGCSTVENQGQLGSCTANALAGDLEFLEKKAGQPATDLSRLFIYYNERGIEGTVAQDSGAQLRDGIKTLAKQGVCPEQEWPYVISKFAVKPPAACYRDGLKHQITSYHRIVTLLE